CALPILSNNYHYLILAGDNVIGHISLVSRRGNWYETAIIIEKKWQGRGFGTEAINVLLKKAKRLGIKKVYLEVRPNNLMAIRAYEKCGLKKNGIKIYPKNKYLSKTIKMAINL
ncbi:MAG: GNAT family N-acetyltransferase, partial [Patescibacteria group bacterium]